MSEVLQCRVCTCVDATEGGEEIRGYGSDVADRAFGFDEHWAEGLGHAHGAEDLDVEAVHECGDVGIENGGWVVCGVSARPGRH